MIDRDWFINKFKKSECDFSEKEISQFYDSVPDMIKHRYIARYIDSETENQQVWPEIGKVAEEQWKILKEIGNEKLDIYRDAEDKKLVAQFIDLIQKEKKLREKMPKEKISYLPEFRGIIDERIKLYETIFDYTTKDIQEVKKIARKKANELLKKRYKKVTVKAGIIGGVVGAGLASAVLGGISLIKKRKEKKKKNKTAEKK